MAYERLITRNEKEDTILIDGVPIDTMGGSQLMIALGKVVSRLNKLEDKIERGELVDTTDKINYEMF